MYKERKKFCECLGFESPIDAIEAMLKGLKKARKRKTFRVQMNTYGDYFNGVCFGCAATITLQEASGRNFKADDSICSRPQRARYVGVNASELCYFEFAMDRFRRGDVSSLFTFFYSPKVILPAPGFSWYMDSCNWETCIPNVRRYLQKLKKIRNE
jgi:hypothetical protein